MFQEDRNFTVYLRKHLRKHKRKHKRTYLRAQNSREILKIDFLYKAKAKAAHTGMHAALAM